MELDQARFVRYLTLAKRVAASVALEQMDRAALEAYVRQIAREEIGAGQGEE